MAIVNALRFSDNAGAMIADEEYWVWGRRRSFFTDHIYPLCDEQLSEKLNMQLVYGGIGHPPFHLETVEHLKKRLAEGKEGYPETTEEVGYMLLEEAQKTIQRRINDQLNFLYGVTIDDINRGYFEVDNKKYDIKQKKILTELTNVVMQKGNNDFLKPIYKSRGVLMGLDPQHGFTMFHMNYDKSAMAFVSGGFEAVGTGKYASGIAFGQYLNNLNVAERRDGVEPLRGLFTLFESALLASESFKEVGGYLKAAVILRDNETMKNRLKLIQGHDAKLAAEIVQAYRTGYIALEIALSLFDRLVHDKSSFDEIEDELFQATENPFFLELRLAGFKTDYERIQMGKENTVASSEEVKKSSKKRTPKSK